MFWGPNRCTDLFLVPEWFGVCGRGWGGWVGCSRALLMQCEGKVLPKILYSSIDFTEIIFCPTNVICEDFVL